jgi:hypothetical protein
MVLSHAWFCRIAWFRCAFLSTMRSGAQTTEHLPVNIKVLLIADVDGDGLNELVVGKTDRVVIACVSSHFRDAAQGISSALLIVAHEGKVLLHSTFERVTMFGWSWHNVRMELAQCSVFSWNCHNCHTRRADQ